MGNSKNYSGKVDLLNTFFSAKSGKIWNFYKVTAGKLKTNNTPSCVSGT